MMSHEHDILYAGNLRLGVEFEDFAKQKCYDDLGLVVVSYSSKKYQLAEGEGRTCVEIKYDMKLSKTGNIWIETHEKSNPSVAEYSQAGIYRDDNSWLYLIGDYDRFWVFSKTMLKLLDGSKTCEGIERFPVKENESKTSLGFLLSAAEADKYADKKWPPDGSEF